SSFYFLLALTTVLAATANAGPVLDIDGDIIFHGSYYVIPVIRGPEGGGLTLTTRNGNQCPLFIGQERSEVERGIPVKFSNWRSRVGFVPESENLNIKMDIEYVLRSVNLLVGHYSPQSLEIVVHSGWS
ncbi:unnamed protein product, partial [Brassica oleracea]